MKIKTEYGHIVDIFGIYWVNSVENNQVETILLGLPRGNGGLTPFRITGSYAENVEIVDPVIPNDFIYNNSGIYHKALIEDKLLNDVCEYDEIAYATFLEILKAEGQIEPDFY